MTTYGISITTLYVCDAHGCRFRDPANASADCGAVTPVVFADDIV